MSNSPSRLPFASRSPGPLREWFHVRYDESTIELECEPPGGEHWTQAIAWESIERIVFKAEDPSVSDGIYLFTRGRKESYAIPAEAAGGADLWKEIIRRGLFDAGLAIEAAGSIGGVPDLPWRGPMLCAAALWLLVFVGWATLSGGGAHTAVSTVRILQADDPVAGCRDLGLLSAKDGGEPYEHDFWEVHQYAPFEWTFQRTLTGREGEEARALAELQRKAARRDANALLVLETSLTIVIHGFDRDLSISARAYRCP